jgi:hypothetical protein
LSGSNLGSEGERVSVGGVSSFAAPPLRDISTAVRCCGHVVLRLGDTRRPRWLSAFDVAECASSRELRRESRFLRASGESGVVGDRFTEVSVIDGGVTAAAAAPRSSSGICSAVAPSFAVFASRHGVVAPCSRGDGSIVGCCLRARFRAARNARARPDVESDEDDEYDPEPPLLLLLLLLR